MLVICYLVDETYIILFLDLKSTRFTNLYLYNLYARYSIFPNPHAACSCLLHSGQAIKYTIYEQLSNIFLDAL